MRTSTWLQLLTVAAGSALLVARHRRYQDLRGATAVVTGGSRGLGLAIARELVRAGAHVTLLARTASDLERARGELAAMGGDVVAPCATSATPRPWPARCPTCWRGAAASTS